MVSNQTGHRHWCLTLLSSLKHKPDILKAQSQLEARRLEPFISDDAAVVRVYGRAEQGAHGIDTEVSHAASCKTGGYQGSTKSSNQQLTAVLGLEDQEPIRKPLNKDPNNPGSSVYAPVRLLIAGDQNCCKLLICKPSLP